MAMPKLTQAMAERWPLPKRGEAHVADAGQPGLSLRVRASGARTWQVLYRTGGRATPLRRMSLGSVEKISLKAARDLARKALLAVASGIDPAAQQKAAQRGRLAQLGLLVDAYIADLEARQATPQSVRNIASLLKRELVVPLGPTTDIATIINQSISRVIFSLTWRISRDSCSVCKRTMRVNWITQPWRPCGCARCEACKTAKAPRMSHAHCELVRARCIDGWRSTVAVDGMH